MKNKDTKSINQLPAPQGPSTRIGNINGVQGNPNPPLSPVTNSPRSRGGFITDDDHGGRDYDGPPGLSGASDHTIISAASGADHPYLEGDTQDSYPGPGDPASGRTPRGAADGGIPSVSGGNVSGPPYGRVARGAADGGIGRPYSGGA